MIILIMIMMIMIMMIIIMIKIIILYTFLFSSFSSCETCFQEWCCEKCDTVFHFERNYNCHKRICSGVNMYRCQTCGNVYKSKKSLHGHKRKQHTYDVCHFTFFHGECELYQFLTYIMQMWTENFS